MIDLKQQKNKWQLYINSIFCTKCRDGTKHLLIGDNREDVYIYGDNALDERFFIY